MRGTYGFAGMVVEVASLHGDVHELCRGYRCGGSPDLRVRTTQADIDRERERAARPGRPAPRASDGHLEGLAVHRQIAELMPAHGAFVLHGSAVAVDGVAYLFAARSGTGKSTHARLWREMLGARAVMVNDDKPLVRVGDGGVTVYGTPWDGKHRLSRNVAVPLRAVCLLARAGEDHIERVPAARAYPALLRQVYRPADPAALAATLALLDRLVERVGLWRLGCTMGAGAARVSYEAMRG